MKAQRRFKLAYPRSLASSAFRRPPRTSDRKAVRRLTSRTPVTALHESDEDLNVLLDEDFDDLFCDPRILLQLANQN
ncbi:hypothetical protein [uncultured Bosea sp.]|jgi:hypothetical protein|uniref:hypothetical protein n=1 Tax=uncultured Bosea sp. TaxID=211457 RepID=UPI0025FBA063|nr:hypothetical protein [uncultured Bosea sp.]